MLMFHLAHAFALHLAVPVRPFAVALRDVAPSRATPDPRVLLMPTLPLLLLEKGFYPWVLRCAALRRIGVSTVRRSPR